MQSVSTHAPLAGSDGHLVVDRHSVALFQPTLPLRGATVVLGLDSRGLWFQPTLPLRGATRPLGFFARLPRFNPRSPCGERQAARSSSRPSSCRFNPRSPCGERPFAALLWRVTPRFNPRSPCGERRGGVPSGQPRNVSTHAPLAGSDGQLGLVPDELDVSTHAPLAGSDLYTHTMGVLPRRFQPTLPLRGATLPARRARMVGAGFNPRSPCGERPTPSRPRSQRGRFQPTLPLRGATGAVPDIARPREFQPTLPLRGATYQSQAHDSSHVTFQPTLPLRGATATSC